MDNLIQIENLTYRYDNKDESILKNINLSIKRGEFVAVIGCNGCGKSTLVRNLNGLLIPSEGRVFVDGFDTSLEDNLPVIRRKVGMVFQNPDNQLFASVVEEDVAFGLENMCLETDVIRERVDRALGLLGMSAYSKHPPYRLSGGQKQKVAIAGILAMEPECIVLDEPTSMLDPLGRKEVMGAIQSLNRDRGITVIYVTHDMTETLYSDRLVVLAGGEILYDGDPQGFFIERKFLNTTGIEPPPIVELAEFLENNGLKSTTGIKTPEELVDMLCL